MRSGRVRGTPRSDAAGSRRRRVLGEPLVERLGDRRVLADDDEDGWPRVLGLRLPGQAQLVPQTGEHGDRRVGVLQDRLGLRRSARAAAFGGRQLRFDPSPDVEVAGDLGAGGVAHGELRDLDQPGLDRVGEREVADHPRERPVGVLADAPQEVRRRREVDAEVDAAELVDAVEPVDPHRGFLVELLGVVLIAEQVVLVRVGLFAPDAVGVVRLVVEDQRCSACRHRSRAPAGRARCRSRRSASPRRRHA